MAGQAGGRYSLSKPNPNPDPDPNPHPNPHPNPDPDPHQAGVRYSLSKPQSYMRNNLQCFVALLETHRRFPQVKISLYLPIAP